MTSSRPAAVAATCDLCGAPADDGPSVAVRLALGPCRRVRLCVACQDDRPGRGSGELVADDRTWALLERETAALADDYESDRWLPYRDELHWVQNLARRTWTQGVVDQALRDAGDCVRAGRLVPVVELLSLLLPVVDDGDPALRSLRRLLGDVAAGPA